MDTIVARWRCPDCGLFGAVASSMPDATSLAAHARVVGCDLEAAPAAPPAAKDKAAPRV